ncbi:PucR family transcriptional regulator [Actinomadura gamaensis]|uniref:PucR family transcriptional regulator n=1 Tax=Actinomadura gamaensis TaxID=1763541 RepID=A0ABV9U4D0_9ACTN
MSRLVDFSGLAAEQRRRLADAADELRPYVPAIAGEAAESIRREIPQYGRPHDPRYGQAVSKAVEELIGHFIDLMGERDVSSDEVLAYFRELGAGEAREGRSLDVWQASVRIGAGIAIGRLTEQAEKLGLGGNVSEVGYIAREVFAYTDRIAEVVGEGHAEAQARAEGEREGRRRRLIDLLLTDEPDAGELREAAGRAGWALPQTVAAVALALSGRDPAHRPALPPDALVGLHLEEPCVIMPDPEGPGRRHQLETGLDGWVAAVGPAVGTDRVARSLRWARRALGLATEGVIGDDKLIVATEHMPLLVMTGERDLVALVADRRLAPLRKVRPALRRVLAETLLALIECRFNATVVATRLSLHAQTVRYRLRKLEDLFGPVLHEPAVQLELHMVLRAWLAMTPDEAE